MVISKDNLLMALKLAIKAREEKEKASNFTSDSAMLAAWREACIAVQDGEKLEVRENPKGT